MASQSIAIVAGEASGDLQGAALVEEMRRRQPGLTFWGIGAARMRATGVELLYDSSNFSAIGLPEVIAKIPRLSSVLHRMKRELMRRRPDLFIPIDFGTFNLRLAAHAKDVGVPVFAYFPPGSWSRDSGRATRIASVATRIATPFPWSETILREAGAHATFVGHPLLDVLAPHLREREARARDSAPVIALMPGSRLAEVRHILRPMLDAADLIAAEMPEASFGVSLAPTIDEALVRDAVAGRSEFITLERDAHRLLARSSAAIVKSGSVTLEAAVLGVPMIIVYAGSRLSEWYFRRAYQKNVPLIGMPNILAGRQIIPELLQRDMTPDRMAAEVLHLLRDANARAKMLGDLREAVALLGTPGAIARTAELALELL